MTKEVEIEAKRSFNKTPQGDICDVGERFTVGETRAVELERLGLAERTKPEAEPVAESGSKRAPKPSNKMAPAPAEKAED